VKHRYSGNGLKVSPLTGDLERLKMPSTYISLLLLCGFMYVFYFTQHAPRNTKSPATHPVVKEIRPVVKRFLPAQSPAFSLDKNYNNEKDPRQTRLNETGFSFFRDVICRTAPILENLR
jgi:hypothetical protein